MGVMVLESTVISIRNAVTPEYTVGTSAMTPNEQQQQSSDAPLTPRHFSRPSVVFLCLSVVVLMAIGTTFFDLNAFLRAWHIQGAAAAHQLPVPGGLDDVRTADIVALPLGVAVDVTDADVRLTVDVLADERCSDADSDACGEDGRLRVEGSVERISTGERGAFTFLTGDGLAVPMFGKKLEMVGVSIPLEVVYVRLR